jgi:hypothetical protein
VTGSAQGIDVSNYAGQFDWAGTSGLSFGICQGTTPGPPTPWSAWISSFQPEPVEVVTEVQSGQLNNGANAVTVITVPLGSASAIAFGCDNGLQGLAPAVLRVGIYDTEWHLTQPITVPAKTGVISVRRQDAGAVTVGWEVS